MFVPVATAQIYRGLWWAVFVVAVPTFISVRTPAVAQQRALGIDVSAWQGNLLNWNTLRNTNNRQFAFIRSSRGGTTGFYNQSDPNNTSGLNTYSQRYDDPYFVQNINGATSAGMFAGPYHYGRADIVTYQGPDPDTGVPGTITHTGRDEANHMLQMAGAWMRPGYLLPVYDLESGNTQRSTTSLSNFAVAFSDRIYEVMGIRPMVYINSSYANDEVNASVAAAMPNLWIARWPNQNNPNAIDVQNLDPPAAASYPNVYGVWNPTYPNTPNPHPWKFWQYASTARLSGYNNGNSNIDVNVAHGGLEFLKDYLVPALWMNDASGDWSTLTNWNSGQTPAAPVQGPGQVPRVGPLTLPAVRLPAADDTVILDRPNANISVTLSGGSHNIRKLYVREELNLTGGSLVVNYVPSADSTPIAAQFSAPVSLSDGASLSVHTLQVDATQTFSLDGGSLTFDRILLMPHTSTPARLVLNDDIEFTPLAGVTATVVNGMGGGASGTVDLGGGNRSFVVLDGPAPVDMLVGVPVVNGGLTKAGGGTLALAGNFSYAGDTVVESGMLSLGNPNLANGADVFLTSGAALQLNFAGSVQDAIDSLYIDGVSQPAGVWGPVGSGAQFTTPLLTGTGFLQVSTYVPGPAIPGDYNGDGLVDAADYDVWRAAFGHSVAIGAGADGNGDGFVDAEDYVIWRRHTNALAASSQQRAAVPEPHVLILLVTAVGTVYWAAEGRRRAPITAASSMP